MSFEFMFVLHPQSDVALVYDVVVLMWHCIPFACIPNYYVMVRCNDVVWLCYRFCSAPLIALLVAGEVEDCSMLEQDYLGISQ